MDYTYDAWARLKTSLTTGSTQFAQWGLKWAYDRYGNRTNQTVTHGSGPSSSLGISTSTNRITDTGYSYDANGNLLANGTITLTYNSENRVLTDSASAHSFSYDYDSAGLRARKRNLNFGGTKDVIYIYSGAQVLAEYEITTPTGSSTTTVLTEYIYAGSQKLASIVGGTSKYYLNDHLSARVTTDSSGGNAVEQGHYPFGEDWYAGTGASKFKFTTYERDTAQSDYAVFRNYHFLNGRFNRPDPIGGSPLDPQSLNRYAYVRNSPCTLIDPLGLESCTFYVSMINKAGLSPDQIKEIQDRIKSIFGTTTGLNGESVTVRFVPSGGDTTLTIAQNQSWVSRFLNGNAQGTSGIGGSSPDPTLFLKNMDYSNTTHWGTVGTHELGHKLGGFRNLKWSPSVENIMVTDNIPAFVDMNPSNLDSPMARFSQAQISELFKRCSKLRGGGPLSELFWQMFDYYLLFEDSMGGGGGGWSSLSMFELATRGPIELVTTRIVRPQQ